MHISVERMSNLAIGSEDRSDASSFALLHLLSNPLLLAQVTERLPLYTILSLGATSTGFRDLIYRTPHVFRHLDLSPFKAAQVSLAAIDHGGEIWRNVQLDENVTEEDFYGGPLRGILSNIERRNVLQDVRTLILDGLSVPFELIHDLTTDPIYNIQILSIREVQNLNERKLMQALLYLCRPSRPKNTPRLQGLYIFGPKEPPETMRAEDVVETIKTSLPPGVMTSQGAQIGAEWNTRSEEALSNELLWGGDKWYRQSGRIVHKEPIAGWAEVVQACRGIINFDTALCTGPRHQIPDDPGDMMWYHEYEYRLPATLALFAVGPCSSCGEAPEGLSKYGQRPAADLPLLAPPPKHTSSIREATRPAKQGPVYPAMVARCQDCIRHRYCNSCKKWWCENCYAGADRMPSSALNFPHGHDANARGPLLDDPYERTTKADVKVHMGLCIEDCLVWEMESGSGSNGMWG